MTDSSRRVLVTGATSGIGHSIARVLLERGERVVGVGRRAEVLEALERDYPERFHPMVSDLCEQAERSALFDDAERVFGGLDAIVCAAGLFVHETLGNITESALESQLAVNFRSPLSLCEQGVSRLSEGGSVLVLSSTLAARPIATSAVYSATKAAIEAVVKVAAQSGAARKVRVNAIALGVVDTPMARQTRPDGLDEAAQLKALGAVHPLGLGDAREVAEAAVALLGQPWTTGSIMTMDGGLICR
jgi:NAD(P)-dependent dehydrogenase (short-subunit alcohol dehydrogenase family)